MAILWGWVFLVSEAPLKALTPTPSTRKGAYVVGELGALVRRGVFTYQLVERAMAHIGQSKPDSGLGFQVKVFKTF